MRDLQQARHILEMQEAEPQEALALAKRLKNAGHFGYAWKVLARTSRETGVGEKLRLKLVQQQVLCTYQDTDLPADERFDSALELLEKEADLRNTLNQETLGLAGAIHKRKWQLNGRKEHLEDAFAYYYRGYFVTSEQAGEDYDNGYTGINAAFVLDLLANQEAEEAERIGATPELAKKHRELAQSIRENLLSRLLDLPERPEEQRWWFRVTVAEAYFGLENYKEARHWLEKATELEVPDWEYGSTARQLASIARLQGIGEGSAVALEEPSARDILCDFLSKRFESGETVASAMFSSFTGKVGLALSGGGFRASLFHIGVLAQLAELGVLPRVEVLSCVSGGSIIGAYYYLKVRKLLQNSSDGEIKPEDYVKIVEEIAEEFLAGVQRNIRTRVAAEFRTNFKMALFPNYSRTERLGDLLEREIFSRADDGEGDGSLKLNDLSVRPYGEQDGFRPKWDNWRRSAKVPVLILNATSLNTGHSWQFTVSQMGESPSIDAEIDTNYLMRSMSYGQAPEQRYREFPLGRAVAASACVPGLFEPLVLNGLYEKKDEERKEPITVRLVDGGVYDNQGVMGLLEEECDVFLVSDASGQMEAQEGPGDGLLSVSLRSNNILMGRIRESQHRHLKALARSSKLRRQVFVHLKKGLEQEPIAWIDCDEPYVALDRRGSTEQSNSSHRYRVPREVQERLAAIRTDLDSFNDTEAHALMTSGYRMTEQESEDLEDLSQPTEIQRKWRFLGVEERMRQAFDGSKDFMRLLDVASKRGFKIWRLSGWLQAIAILLGIALAGGLILACLKWWSQPIFTIGEVVSAIVAAAAILFVVLGIKWAVGYSKALSQIGIGVGMATFGWVAARAHLHFFDRQYLRRGLINSSRKEATSSPTERYKGDSGSG